MFKMTRGMCSSSSSVRCAMHVNSTASQACHVHGHAMPLLSRQCRCTAA
jgi:hypothetical protein